MRLRGVLLLAATASVGVLLMLAGPASAANLHCGQTLTSSVTLIGNLDCSGYILGPAITIGHDGVTLSLNGYKITGGPGEPVVDVDGYNSATIKGGTLAVTGGGKGIYNHAGGNGLTVAGVTIAGDSSSTASYGIDSDDSDTGLSVTGGSISGVYFGIYLYGNTGALIKGNKFTEYDGAYSVYSGGDMTGTQIVSNTFSEASGDTNFGYAYYGDTDAGTLFSGNTVTGYYYGVYDEAYSAGLTVTGNVIDGNNEGIHFNEYGSGDMVAGNYIKNSVGAGIEDIDSFNDTYNGNVLTSNGATSNSESYYIAPDGFGPVTMVNNYARTGNGYGFFVFEAYNASVPGGPYSLFSGNVATANGSADDPAFYDEYSVGATWSKNVSNSNNYDGFDFCAPWRETVTGNSANLNGGDGYDFEYDCDTFTDTPENEQPLAVTNNSATNNGGYGFEGEYPTAGSGNTGSKTNADGDCYLVAGCS